MVKLVSQKEQDHEWKMITVTSLNSHHGRHVSGGSADEGGEGDNLGGHRGFRTVLATMLTLILYTSKRVRWNEGKAEATKKMFLSTKSWPP
jgi:hypothetical protein